MWVITVTLCLLTAPDCHTVVFDSEEEQYRTVWKCTDHLDAKTAQVTKLTQNHMIMMGVSLPFKMSGTCVPIQGEL